MKIHLTGNTLAEKTMQTPFVKRELAKLKRVLKKVPQIEWPYKSRKQPGIKILQPALATWIEQDLSACGWSPNMVGNSESNSGARRVGFIKEDVKTGVRLLVQVQFGNSGRMYADFYKFLTAYRRDEFTLGILIVLSRDTAKVTDSGLVTYESVVEHMIEGEDGATKFPLVCMGLNHEDVPAKTIDFSKAQFDSSRIFAGKGIKKALGSIIASLRHDKSTLSEVGLTIPPTRVTLKNPLNESRASN